MGERRLPCRVPQMGMCLVQARDRRTRDGSSSVRGMPGGMRWIKTLYAYWALTKYMDLCLVLMRTHWRIIYRGRMLVLKKKKNRLATV